MKRRMILCIVITSIFIACSKDEPSTPLPSLSANIDGSSWSSDARITVLTSNTFAITATSLDGKTLLITINGSTPDTYTLNISSIEFAATYKETATTSYEDTYLATSGEVVLSSVNTTDHKISGTFNFTMRKSSSLIETINVTNGTFTNITYTINDAAD